MVWIATNIHDLSDFDGTDGTANLYDFVSPVYDSVDLEERAYNFNSNEEEEERNKGKG